MGAGQEKDHFIQDSGELYFVCRVQEILEKKGVSISSNSHEKYSEFIKYVTDRDMLDEFTNSVYCESIESRADDFVNELMSAFADKKMDIINVEVEYRNLGKKGDFLIKVSDGRDISFSLKNYKNGGMKIQLCSGTWASTLLNFIFVKEGKPGMYLDSQGNSFKGSDVETRNSILQTSYPEVIPILSQISEINDMIKQKYVYGEDASNWDNISAEWKKDCNELGSQGINLMINALKILPQEVIKNRVIKMAGLDRVEELLVLTYSKKGTNMLCSLTNEKYKRMVGDICSPECSLDYKKKGKSLVFTFIKDEKKVIEVDIPFTFNANGAWHRPAKYEGTQFHQKEGVELAWGDRRPKKSKELATSTNTYMSIKPYF